MKQLFQNIIFLFTWYIQVIAKFYHQYLQKFQFILEFSTYNTMYGSFDAVRAYPFKRKKGVFCFLWTFFPVRGMIVIILSLEARHGQESDFI